MAPVRWELACGYARHVRNNSAEIAEAGGHTLGRRGYGRPEFHILLNHSPTRVIIFLEQTEKLREIDRALPDDGEYFFFDCFLEGQFLAARFLEHLAVHILNVQEPQHARELSCLGDRVATCIFAMSGVEAQSDAGVRGRIEKAFALLGRLDISRYVRMKHEIEPELPTHLGRFLDNMNNILPLRGIETRASILREVQRQLVANLGLGVGQNQERSLKRSQQISDFTNLSDRDSGGRRIAEHDGDERPEQFQFPALQLGFQYNR